METVEGRYQRDGAPMRVPLAGHGYEPPGWAPEAWRIAAKSGHATLRVRVIGDEQVFWQGA